MSHAAMRALGWERTDPRPWGKLSARWDHDTGWSLQHCGHPTALRQWQVIDAGDRLVETAATLHDGALFVAKNAVGELLIVAVLEAPTVLKPWDELTDEERKAEARAAREAVGIGNERQAREGAA